MRRNYKVSEHRVYHAWRRTVDCVTDCARAVAPAVWKGFLQPVIVLAVGVGLSAPFAQIASNIIHGMIWR